VNITTKKLIEIGLDGETVLQTIGVSISGSVYVAIILKSERVILLPFGADAGIYETSLSDFKVELSTIISEMEVSKTTLEKSITDLSILSEAKVG